MKKALLYVTSHLVGRPQFTHLGALPTCWRPSAAVRGDLQVSTCMSDGSVRHILHTDLNLHPYKLQIFHSLGDRDKQVSLQFGHHFQAILIENPDLLNNHLMSDKTHLYLHGSVNKLNY